MYIAAINDYLGLGAHLLKLGNFLGGVADKFLLPLRKDPGPSRAVNLHPRGDVNERKPRLKLSGYLRGARDGIAAVVAQINCAKNAPDGEFARRRFFCVSVGPNRTIAVV